MPSSQEQHQTGPTGLSTAADLDTLQFVTFLVDEEVLGVPMSSVREIIRMPAVVRVPLSPPSLEGLANLRGRVLPIIDLRVCFGLPRVAHGEATRVIVAECGIQVGFIVDRVASVVSVGRERIESADTVSSRINTQLITGIIKQASGDQASKLVVLLDLPRVLSQEFSALLAARAAGAGADAGGLGAGAGDEPSTAADVAVTNELQLVSFQVAGQEYAFPIQRVQEIVQVPSAFCEIPNAGPHVLGVMTLRDRLLPVVSLREMFQLPKAELEEHNRIVVLALDPTADEETPAVGIVMDRVKEVLRLPTSSVGPLPELLARDQRTREVESICRLDGGKRLVSVLSVERMFEHEVLNEAVGLTPGERRAENHNAEEAQMGSDDEEQLVVFRLENEEYGVLISEVQEILRVAEQFTRVPKAAHFIEGLVSLRGEVLPVVDLRRRFGMSVKERDERQRVMVLSVQGVRTGVIVDAVSEVLKVPRAGFEPAPTLSSEQAQVIRRVANLEKQKRMILVLEACELFDEVERTQLEAVA